MRDVDAFPLTWPDGYERTKPHMREYDRFKATLGKARDQVKHEVELFGGTDLVISSMIPTKRNGDLYASATPKDGEPGVSVWFVDEHGSQKVFACDKFRRLEANLWAIGLTINALRGIERWGSSELLTRAFTGFTALPAAPKPKPWTDVLGCPGHSTVEHVNSRRRALLFENHPDRGGSESATAEINRAWDEFKSERGLS